MGVLFGMGVVAWVLEGQRMVASNRAAAVEIAAQVAAEGAVTAGQGDQAG